LVLAMASLWAPLLIFGGCCSNVSRTFRSGNTLTTQVYALEAILK
jgi:hypothetical protein